MDQLEENSYTPRRGREGSRWFNERPSGQELATWFRESVPLHAGMDHADYISGIVLIESTDQVSTIVGYKANGEPIITTVTELSYAPYPRADARIAYFWNYCHLNRYVGSIEPVGGGANSLPPGFFIFAHTDPRGTVQMVGRTMIAKIVERGVGPVAKFPSETKMVPVLRNGLVDADAFAKASTGAIGRALGAAGMLVIPGSGVATAEDMRAAPATPAPEVAPPAPEQELSEEELRKAVRVQLKSIIGTDKEEELGDWWAQRRLPSEDALNVAQLQAAHLKLRALLFDAQPTVHRVEP